MDAKPYPFQDAAKMVANVLTEKNASYGDATTVTASIAKLLWSEGIPVSQLDEALVVIRMLDKLCRIAKGTKFANEDAWLDLAGYALLVLAKGMGEKRDACENHKAVIADMDKLLVDARAIMPSL